MLIFKASDGSLINPLNVNFVYGYLEDGRWVVNFDFGATSRELMFDTKEKAESEIERFWQQCKN